LIHPCYTAADICLDQDWRARTQIYCKFRRNSFECPWKFWREKNVLECSTVTINY